MQLDPVQMIKALIGLLLFLLLVPLTLFWSAGTLAWPAAWGYVTLLIFSSVVSRSIVFKQNPEALRERARFTSADDVPGWDRVLVIIVGLVGPVLMALIAGLDYRFGWSPSISIIFRSLGGLLVVIGFGLAVWAMIENPYFSSVARIQEDRGHEVISRGPYRFVRHPAYVGSLLAAVGFPLLLSALWSYLPGAIYIFALVIRTYLEDQLLHEGLQGYRDYEQEISSRLIPGIW
mgnify:CR=1 FL=1